MAVFGASLAAAAGATAAAEMEAATKSVALEGGAAERGFVDEMMDRIFGFGGGDGSGGKKEGSNGDESSSEESPSGDEEVEVDADSSVEEGRGPGKRVVVDLDPELVESLPEMSLTEVRQCSKKGGRLLASYEGIVYDITEFADAHPGGRELLLTAAGMDLAHYFDNYTVHGNTAKAAEWLAPLAVGRLVGADVEEARTMTTSAAHVERRFDYLGRARTRILCIAATLPLWMGVRQCVRLVGWFVPACGRFLARWVVPVAVPGFSPGAEQLKLMDCDGDSCKPRRRTVAIVGGGIAGCGAAWALRQSGFDVVLYEARASISGNARTFDWDFSEHRSNEEEKMVKSCCSVTAWPPTFYKNYTCLLEALGVETVHQPLSWFLNSKVEGAVGTLWAADPSKPEASLRRVLKKDFEIYGKVVQFSDTVCNLFTMRWAPWRRNDTPTMYDGHRGLGLLNPLNVVPLYSLFRFMGGSELWWQVVFTPHYTASFLVDELRPFPAVFGPLIEAQIPLLPNATNARSFTSKRSETDCHITTCHTWKDAGKGIREVFDKLTDDIDVRVNTRVREVEILPSGKKRVHDENDKSIDVDRVVFACPANAIGNMHKKAGWLANAILNTPVYADDHHPDSGHMHAVIHSDPSVIDAPHREECLKRASNYVEVTTLPDGSINIENQYNFGVQTPGPGVYDLPLDKKPVMLISHALGEGKAIDPKLVRGTANHARAHPLYSGWNVMAMLSLRLVQGQDGVYYCSNWTTPGNCHDMSFLSGLVCAHAIGAEYPFGKNVEAKKDFHRLRDLMGF